MTPEMIEEAERLQAERGGRRTSAKPREIGGTIGMCWSTGILRTEWRAVVGGKPLRVIDNARSSGFSAMVDGVAILGKGGDRPRRFTSLTGAMEFAANLARSAR